MPTVPHAKDDDKKQHRMSSCGHNVAERITKRSGTDHTEGGGGSFN